MHLSVVTIATQDHHTYSSITRVWPYTSYISSGRTPTSDWSPPRSSGAAPWPRRRRRRAMAASAPTARAAGDERGVGGGAGPFQTARIDVRGSVAARALAAFRSLSVCFCVAALLAAATASTVAFSTVLLRTAPPAGCRGGLLKTFST